jgi:hypothetical protein
MIKNYMLWYLAHIQKVNKSEIKITTFGVYILNLIFTFNDPNPTCTSNKRWWHLWLIVWVTVSAVLSAWMLLCAEYWSCVFSLLWRLCCWFLTSTFTWQRRWELTKETGQVEIHFPPMRRGLIRRRNRKGNFWKCLFIWKPNIKICSETRVLFHKVEKIVSSQRKFSHGGISSSPLCGTAQ